jgi:hypothetical protein
MKILAVIFLSLFMLSCGHHRDVRAGADGIHRVKFQTDDKDQGTQHAIAQANHYCEQSKRQAAFIDENTTYTGHMSEKDYQATKTVGKVGKAVGGTVWAMGGKRESNAGGVLGLGGIAADAIAGEGYTVEMRFKCQ